MPSLSRKTPMITANAKVNATYTAVVLRPKNIKNNAIIPGFSKGEDIRKDIAPQNGAPLLNSPTRTGIVEHEQKGVRAPSAAPSMLFNPFLGAERIVFIFSVDMYL
jgi:hypothetical protein